MKEHYPLRAVPPEPTISDIAYSILADSTPRTVACDQCDRGRVEGPNGESWRCFQCGGNGRVRSQP